MGFVMKYETDEGLETVYHIDEDATLDEVFAKFVDMTRIMGYQDNSWSRTINHVMDYIDDGPNTVFDWSCDTI